MFLITRRTIENVKWFTIIKISIFLDILTVYRIEITFGIIIF